MANVVPIILFNCVGEYKPLEASEMLLTALDTGPVLNKGCIAEVILPTTAPDKMPLVGSPPVAAEFKPPKVAPIMALPATEAAVPSKPREPPKTAPRPPSAANAPPAVSAPNAAVPINAKPGAISRPKLKPLPPVYTSGFCQPPCDTGSDIAINLSPTFSYIAV